MIYLAIVLVALLGQTRIRTDWDHRKDRPIFDEVGNSYKMGFKAHGLSISKPVKISRGMDNPEADKQKYNDLMDTLKTLVNLELVDDRACGKDWYYIKMGYKKIIFRTDGMIVLGWNKGKGTYYWVVEDMFVLADTAIVNLRIRSEKGSKVRIWIER